MRQDIDAALGFVEACPEVTDVTAVEAVDTELRSRMRRYAKA